MNILGIGIDIVNKIRIKNIWNKYNIKFATKILNNNELQAFIINKNKVKFLIKSFSIKEAIVKALGTGFRKNISLKNINISNNYLGKPIIQFSKNTIQLNLNTKILISISHEKNTTIAFAIIIKL